MSTATVSQEPTQAQPSANVVKENYTLVVGWPKEEMAKEKVDERKLKAYPESDDIEKQIAEGEFTESFRQTFGHPVPQNADGINELIPDQDEQFNLISKQLTVKLVNKSRSTVLGKDFKPQDGAIDLTAYAGEKSERRLSSYEKTVRTIEQDFDASTRSQLLALLLKQAKESGVDVSQLVG